MAGVTIQTEVLDSLTPTLHALAAAAVDLSPAMDEISELLLEETEDHFRRETGPDGVPWQKSQRAIADGGRTLYLSGDLFNALDRESGTDFAQAGVLGVGGPLAYAKTHNFGATILNAFGRGDSVTVPKRQYIGLRPTTPDAVDDILSAHLAAATKGTGDAR